VHGRRVVAIDSAESGLEDADALVTTATSTPLCVLGADCALVGLAGEGVVAVAHAGWRGLVAGVIEATVQEMRKRGADEVHAAVSACIHSECYSFSPDDVERVAAVFGEVVRARTARGDAALDLPSAVRSALRRSDVELAVEVDACTACAGDWFSHRARGDRARHALVIWRDAVGG
jgi:polyphenol oxidase